MEKLNKWQNILQIKEQFYDELESLLLFDKDKIYNEVHPSLQGKTFNDYAIEIIKEYFSPELIELFLDDIVYLILYGNDLCAIYATEAILKLDRKLQRKNIVDIIRRYSSQDNTNFWVLHSAYILLYELKYKQELLDFISKYANELEGEFDENDMKDFNNMDDE